MRLLNLRYGFATNSSSTHSVVLIDKKNHITDDGEIGKFGWDFFTARSENAKRVYMGILAMDAIAKVHGLSVEDTCALASAWCGAPIDADMYVDHQSMITLPTVHAAGYNYSRTTQVSRRFFDDMLNFVLKDEVAILGGNDNDEESHSLLAMSEVVSNSRMRKFFYEDDPKSISARYDETGKFWTLFRKKSGDKIRVSFDPFADASKSECPELVDVKITDWCDAGCAYCYQGSTRDGKHASKDVIGNIAYELGELGVFEVALGGGEPTAHPDFLNILDQFNWAGIKPNFSTRKAEYVHEHRDKLRGKVGAIGLSADSPRVLRKQLSLLEPCDLDILVQVAVGSCDKEDLCKMMDICKMFGRGILFLGWKSTERGKSGPAHKVDLKPVLNSYVSKGKFPSWNGPRVSFDTCMVVEMRGWLKDHKVPEYMFTLREGAHSMYIDAVLERMSKSSYDELFMPLPKKDFREGLMEYFQKL